ncbi:MAG: TonB-dependent receptor domain-containing protein [Chitinophagales bacterium]
MARFILLIFTFLLSSTAAFAQMGEIQGKVTDSQTGEAVPFANVAITINGTLAGAQTDFDGFYSIKPVPAGSYEIIFSYIGFQEKRITDVLVRSDKITFLDAQLVEMSELLEAFEVIEYAIPLLQADETSTGSTVTKEDIANLPTREVGSIASQAAGVFQADEGGNLNVKGSRDEATDYYIDGIKVRGTSALPASAIEQLTVVTGGVPARYGDATGGIINITTRGPSNQFAGGLELITSQFLEPYGYNLANFSLSGPLFKVNRGEANERALLGFFISGEYLHENDDDPSSVGIWTASDSALAVIRETPLIRSNASSGFLKQADFVTKNQMTHNDLKPNVKKDEYSFAGKLDFQPIQNLNFTFGGTYNYRTGGTLRRTANYKDYMRRFEMFNAHHMPDVTTQVYRMYGRFTQRFANSNSENNADENAKPSVLQNAYYSVQFDYTKSKSGQQDPIFQDNFFDYGYVGKFETDREKVYAQTTLTREEDGAKVTGWAFQGFQDTNVTFTGSDINSDKSNHNLQYFDLAGDNQDLYYSNLSQISNNGGLLNGTLPTSLSSAYSLSYTPGKAHGTYNKSENDQYRITFNGSFDLKRAGGTDRNKHAIEFGFEYEQRIDRDWTMFPEGLWNVMNARTASFLNGKIGLDADNAVLVVDGEQIAFEDYDGTNTVFSTNDTITYNLIRVGDQDYFDKSLRDKLGVGLLDFIDVNAINPADLSLDMFSPDELFNNGEEYVSYYGYDYTGEKLTTSPGFKDYWTATNDDGMKTRPIDASRPIYMAGFIQDKFAFKDLIFNIGLRVDRFDANQKVPTDIFSPLYATLKAGDVSNLGEHPSTIGDDFVVYVDDEVNPSRITGYRDDNQWYDANGGAIADADVLLANGSIHPYLANPLSDNPVDDIKKDSEYNPDLAFEDYKPQISLNPRIAFSFEISDEAIFFAHYDILTQRPQDRLIATPFDFYYFQNQAVDGVFYNPNLKSERTIDYQIGFKQKLSQTSALTISGFYRELKDMVQITNINYAYPATYSTYGNIDFGTVKGFEFSYDLRRTQNIRLTANYTLQFADVSGSGDRSQANLIDFGVPNLRTIFPASYDARHMLNLNIDYRFDEGSKYEGPGKGGMGEKLLENFGVNFIVRARSGTPYSKQQNATPEGQFGVRARGSLDGTVNGSRLPWSFKVDMRVEKDIKLNFGKKEGKSDRYINVYFLAQNLLNGQNVVNVHSFTGSPEDDGYVTSGPGQETVAGQISVPAFLDQYSAKVNDPNNYSIPRRMRVGVQFNF